MEVAQQSENSLARAGNTEADNGKADDSKDKKGMKKRGTPSGRGRSKKKGSDKTKRPFVSVVSGLMLLY